MIAILLAAGITMPAANLSAIVHDGTAKVLVRFSQDGEGVRISLRGEDGLQITSNAEPIRGRAVQKGERIDLDATFARGPDQSGLTIEVSGKFGGQTLSFTRTFKVGIPSDDQRHKTRENATAPLKRIPIEH